MAAGPTERDGFEQFRSEWIVSQADYQRAIEALKDARRAWTSAHDSPAPPDIAHLGRVRADVDRALEHVAEVHALLAEQFERSCADVALKNADRGGSESSPGFWIERVVGLGLVFTGAVVLYALTIPSLMGPWAGQAMLAGIGLASLFFGLPLLVTGQVRQTR